MHWCWWRAPPSLRAATDSRRRWHQRRPRAPRHRAWPAPLQPCPTARTRLTKADVDTWLDGYMPYALRSGDIAGAVVAVVKDGQVADRSAATAMPTSPSARRSIPARTLFRPGSVSKLFTWTAVMQQVEQGKIDLDADVNRYLDFKIPPRRRQAGHDAADHDPHRGLRGSCQGSDRLRSGHQRFRSAICSEALGAEPGSSRRGRRRPIPTRRPRWPATSSSACRASHSTTMSSATSSRRSA